ncbi:nephrocan-like [Esox lucius]|uniref:nephrocan-like n=1 Tax=Esox lucius TaxID=8010 RepID=UPI0009731B4A|nr:nephrocan-like [Esox lucius]
MWSGECFAMSSLMSLSGLRLDWKGKLVSVDGGLHLPNLTVLELPGNHLRTLPSRLSPNLERLDCRQNSIHEVTFQHLSGMKLLKHLFLENNTIQKFEANALRNNVQLTNLALEQNFLSSIPDGLPESLVRLDLKGNHIVAILEHELRSLKHLQVLNLRRNKLSSLPQITQDLLPRLRTIYLDENPWNCSCELLGVKRTLLARRVEIPNELCTESVSVPEDSWRAYLMAQHRCEEYLKEIEYQVEQTDAEEYYDYDS